MQSCDRGLKPVRVAVVHDYIIGRGQAGCTAGLGCEHRPRLRRGTAVARLQPQNLQVFGAVHDQHPVDRDPALAFDQQRNDQNLVRPGCLG